MPPHLSLEMRPKGKQLLRQEWGPRSEQSWELVFRALSRETRTETPRPHMPNKPQNNFSGYSRGCYLEQEQPDLRQEQPTADPPVVPTLIP